MSGYETKKTNDPDIVVKNEAGFNFKIYLECHEQ